MTDLRAAAQQALEALETLMLERKSIYETAITALRTALAQEHALHELARLGQEIEQEPVAWMRKLFSPELGEFFDYKDGAFARETDSEGWTPLYTTPPAAQRPWVGLTHEEISNLWSWSMTREAELTATTQQHAFAQAIEAKLKEKYWAKPTHISAPTVVDVPPVPLYVKWKAAQRPWQGLTDDDWGWVADKKGTSLDTFDQGAAWAQARLMERNK